jgi:hypothetical protein
VKHGPLIWKKNKHYKNLQKGVLRKLLDVRQMTNSWHCVTRGFEVLLILYCKAKTEGTTIKWESVSRRQRKRELQHFVVKDARKAKDELGCYNYDGACWHNLWKSEFGGVSLELYRIATTLTRSMDPSGFTTSEFVIKGQGLSATCHQGREEKQSYNSCSTNS